MAEKHRAATKKVLEVFGGYNPKTKELKLNQQPKLLEWISRGVEMSPTAKNLLINKKIITGTKVKAWRPKVKEKPAEKKAETKAETPGEKVQTEEKKEAEQAVEEKTVKEETAKSA